MGAGSSRVLEGHTDSVRSIAFSPDGTRLASVSMDETLRIWDVQTGAQVAQVSISRGHPQAEDAVFSPDGSLLASGGFAAGCSAGGGTSIVCMAATGACPPLISASLSKGVGCPTAQISNDSRTAMTIPLPETDSNSKRRHKRSVRPLPAARNARNFHIAKASGRPKPTLPLPCEPASASRGNYHGASRVGPERTA